MLDIRTSFCCVPVLWYLYSYDIVVVSDNNNNNNGQQWTLSTADRLVGQVQFWGESFHYRRVLFCFLWGVVWLLLTMDNTIKSPIPYVRFSSQHVSSSYRTLYLVHIFYFPIYYTPSIVVQLALELRSRVTRQVSAPPSHHEYGGGIYYILYTAFDIYHASGSARSLRSPTCWLTNSIDNTLYDLLYEYKYEVWVRGISGGGNLPKGSRK